MLIAKGSISRNVSEKEAKRFLSIGYVEVKEVKENSKKKENKKTEE